VLVGVVCLAVLLVVHVSVKSVGRLVGTMDTKLAVEDARAISVVEAFLLFFCALLEEHLSQNVFLLLVGVIVPHVVVVGLVKH
jgi:hypothetical protein